MQSTFFVSFFQFYRIIKWINKKVTNNSCRRATKNLNIIAKSQQTDARIIIQHIFFIIYCTQNEKITTIIIQSNTSKNPCVLFIYIYIHSAINTCLVHNKNVCSFACCQQTEWRCKECSQCEKHSRFEFMLFG